MQKIINQQQCICQYCISFCCTFLILSISFLHQIICCFSSSPHNMLLDCALKKNIDDFFFFFLIQQLFFVTKIVHLYCLFCTSKNRNKTFNQIFVFYLLQLIWEREIVCVCVCATHKPIIHDNDLLLK